VTPSDRDREGQGALLGIDKIIHEPSRLLIMSTLYVLEGADFLFLLNQTGLTKGNLSAQLSKLEGTGYLTIVKGYVGKRPHTSLSLTEAGREALAHYRDTMARLLEDLPKDVGS
jgi:DNA-binding MarR family transcriptional regulator